MSQNWINETVAHEHEGGDNCVQYRAVTPRVDAEERVARRNSESAAAVSAARDI